MTPLLPARSVMVPVFTPALSVQLGWVRVEGFWGESKPALMRWAARRAGKARWGPVAPAQRLIWRDRGL
jgi:hypothetical protein